MKRVLLLTGVVALLLGGCGSTVRPEGVVERWLVSLNQGKAGQPERYAPDDLSQKILPNWQKRDPADLDVIEVGRGRRFVPPGRVGAGEQRYAVPFRVQPLKGQEIRGTAELLSIRGEPWTIDELLPAEPGLLVPSEGGKRLGGAPAIVWLAGIALAILLTLGSVALMSTVGRQARVSA